MWKITITGSETSNDFSDDIFEDIKYVKIKIFMVNK